MVTSSSYRLQETNEYMNFWQGRDSSHTVTFLKGFCYVAHHFVALANRHQVAGKMFKGYIICITWSNTTMGVYYI